jgi:hypothetical protein
MLKPIAAMLTFALVAGLTVAGGFGCSPQPEAPDDPDAGVPPVVFPDDSAPMEPSPADVTPAEPPAEESAESAEEEMPMTMPEEGSGTKPPAEVAPEDAPAEEAPAEETPGAV